MKFYRKILIIVIFILFLYLFLRLFHKTGVLSEGFDIQEASDEAKEKKKNFSNPKIQSIANINPKVTPTKAPVVSTRAPITSTSAPVTSTSAPITSTSAPVTSTKAPITSTSAPTTIARVPATTTLVPGRTKEGFYSVPDNKDNSWKLPKSSMSLMQYCIKSSYNTAISGDYVSEEMVSNVVAQGCRFLDYEVFYDGDKDAAYVAYTTDPSYNTINTKNRVLLDTILSKSVRDGFTKAPNLLDPLLIQLRIKSNNKNVYKCVAKSVNSTLAEKLYPSKITENTTLDDIMGKVVLIVDRTLNLDWKLKSKCTAEPNCYDLYALCNLESGSELLRKETYDYLLEQTTVPPHIMDDNINTDVELIRLVEPDLTTNSKYKDIKNPAFKNYVMDYGAQIITYNYNKAGRELNDYENFFNDIGFAFVPISSAIQYFKQ
jgi:Phosphatidylinositol-specific phospholipase C, X domain